MATVNLGSIKFNWQGAYDNATAYAVDDVVSSSGSSYICIAATTGNAPPNATYWEQMSSAGTDGTDLTTTLTTQGDILYRDGSGLARLGAGTSGQVLQTGGSGANPSWTNVSSDFVKLGETGAVSNQASASLNGFFSSDYEIYKVFGYGVWGASSANAFHFRVNTGASYTEDSSSSYFFAGEGRYVTSSSNGTQNSAGWAQSFGRIGWSGGGSTDYDNAWELTIYNAEGSGHKYFTTNAVYWDGNATFGSLTTGNQWRSSTAMTGIRIYSAGGNFNADNIIMYGLKG